jgi:NAD(P)-dependent dehydrogenase (short-subunit alcohol dehydrogenase family)
VTAFADGLLHGRRIALSGASDPQGATIDGRLAALGAEVHALGDDERADEDAAARWASQRGHQLELAKRPLRTMIVPSTWRRAWRPAPSVAHRSLDQIDLMAATGSQADRVAVDLPHHTGPDDAHIAGWHRRQRDMIVACDPPLEAARRSCLRQRDGGSRCGESQHGGARSRR